MPYDPNFPTSLTVATAAQMRAQLTGIVDLIQTIPQGPQGVPGPPGTSVSGAVVDGVTTGPAGGAATAGASFDGANVRFTFGIPRGDVGETGAPGGPGPQGLQGATGPMGSPFTSFVVDGVTTLDPALPATVTTVFDGTHVRLAFGIPRGQQGNEGLQGITGATGATGATGPAFTNFVVESVSTLPPGQPAGVLAFFDGANVRFTFAIPQGLPGPSDLSGTSGNSNSVTPLGLPVSDPPTQAQMQAIANKLDELIAALRR